MGSIRKVDGTGCSGRRVRLSRPVSRNARIEPVQMSAPRGIRNNNPGNIRKSAADWVGKVEGSDPDFETFDTPTNGVRALAKVLIAYQDKHACRTVRQLIDRWAPPNENDTDAYVDAVASAVGVEPDDTIIVDDPHVLTALVIAVIQHENGMQPYSLPTINAGIEAALA